MLGQAEEIRKIYLTNKIEDLASDFIPAASIAATPGLSDLLPLLTIDHAPTTQNSLLGGV
jgi:hypothetical protein